MSYIGNKLMGYADAVPFEERIFNFSMLVAVCLTGIGAGLDLFFYRGTGFNLAFAGVWILVYYFSRFRGHFREASVVGTVVLVSAFFPYNWLYSSGSGGVLPCYSVVFLVVLCTILKGKFRLSMILSFIAVEILLICRDARAAGSFLAELPNYTTATELIIHISVILASVSVLIAVYSNVYARKKRGARLTPEP